MKNSEKLRTALSKGKGRSARIDNANHKPFFLLGKEAVRVHCQKLVGLGLLNQVFRFFEDGIGAEFGDDVYPFFDFFV